MVPSQRHTKPDKMELIPGRPDCAVRGRARGLLLHFITQCGRAHSLQLSTLPFSPRARNETIPSSTPTPPPIKAIGVWQACSSRAHASCTMGVTAFSLGVSFTLADIQGSGGRGVLSLFTAEYFQKQHGFCLLHMSCTFI